MLKKLSALIGPGFVTAALVLGPGSVTVATKMGAVNGYRQLWWLAICWLFMCAYTAMATRIGVVTDRSLLSIASERFGTWIRPLLGFSVFFICCFFQTGDVIGVSASLSTLAGFPPVFSNLLFPLICVTLYCFSPDIYRFIERIMLVMILLMIAAFLSNLFMAHPAPGQLARGLIPGVPTRAQWGLMTAAAATNFVVAAACYQSYLVKEKGWKIADLGKGLRDTLFGITLLFFLVGMITVTSAAVLHPKGIQVNSAAEMAMQLEPLLGRFAKIMFSLGLFAASFSSLAVNALTGGTLLADGLGKNTAMCGKPVRLAAGGVMAFGVIMAFLIGNTPVKSIILMQKLTLLTVPVLAFALLFLSSDRKTMGTFRNPPALIAIGALGFGMVLSLFYNLVKSLLP